MAAMKWSDLFGIDPDFPDTSDGAQWRAMEARVEELERERDEAVAAVERVRALWQRWRKDGWYSDQADVELGAALDASQPEDVVVCRCGNDCDRDAARIDEGHRDSWVLVGGRMYCCDCRDAVLSDISPAERD